MKRLATACISAVLMLTTLLCGASGAIGAVHEDAAPKKAWQAMAAQARFDHVADDCVFGGTQIPLTGAQVLPSPIVERMQSRVFAKAAVSPLARLNEYPYCDTADGKIRVYAYNAQPAPLISPEYSAYICNFFDENNIRQRVFDALDITSIPQEDRGKTIVFFNSALTGGATWPNGDGTYRMEIGLMAGPYVLAHEYTHVIQQNKFRMDYTPGRGWWMEGTADWIGKELTGHDNYLGKLRTIQRSPWEPYDSGSLSNTSSRIYGTAALAMFLQTHDKNVVSKSFSKSIHFSTMRDALNAVLNNKFNSEFAEYAIRMYKPAEQMTEAIPYAASWPDASYLESGPIEDRQSRTLTRANVSLGNLGVDYVRIQAVSEEKRTITISTRPETGVQYWLLTRADAGSEWEYKRMSSDTYRVGEYNTKVKELVVAIVNTSGSTKRGISITAKVDK